MHKFTIYHNPKCSNSRKALEILHNHNINPTIIEYLKTPLNLEQIIQLRSNFDLKDFIRHNESIFNELKLSLEDEASVLAAIVQEPILMQRPIVTYDGKAVIARPPERVLELIDYAMTNKNKATLHFISGKLGSGKTTLAKEIADKQNVIFIGEDFWLSQLFPDAIKTFEDYLLYSKRVRIVIAAHAIELLQHGVSVVFDFAGNRPTDREWVKSIFERAQVAHTLHYIVATDDLCRAQFKQRNLDLPIGSKIITDQEFDLITQHFIPPEQSEGYNVEYHYRDQEG